MIKVIMILKLVSYFDRLVKMLDTLKMKSLKDCTPKNPPYLV